MKITLRFLKLNNACDDGIVDVKKWKLIGLGHESFIKGLLERGANEYAYWLIEKCLLIKTKKVMWAVFCAELVLSFFEDKFPDDTRPRESIEAAKAYIRTPTKEKATKAAYAASSAFAASSDACVAKAFLSAESAAYAACAASLVESATYISPSSASAYAAIEADATIKNKIIDYGLELIKKEV